MLLAVEISALAPALALITESEPIQLPGRKQSTFILSRFVLCHVNELRRDPTKTRPISQAAETVHRQELDGSSKHAFF